MTLYSVEKGSIRRPGSQRGARASMMAVEDKTDRVCGAANQGPEDGPSSPCARAHHLVLDFHPSQRSAASE